MIDLLHGRAEALRVEVPGKKGEGAEFSLTVSGVLEWHQAKRQRGSGQWTIAQLAADGVLKSWLEKIRAGGRCVFVSGTGAQDLRELSDRSRDATSWEEFDEEFLSSTGYRENFHRLGLALGSIDDQETLHALRNIHVRVVGESELASWVRDRLGALVGTDPAVAAAVLGQMADESVHRPLGSGDVWSYLQRHGIAQRGPGTGSPSESFLWSGDPPTSYDVVLERLALNHPVCLGRRTERTELNRHLRAGDSRTVLLTGDAWCGKTTFLLHYRRQTKLAGRTPVRFISFFASEATADNTPARFLYWVNSQLALYLGDGDGVAPGARAYLQLIELWERASRRAEERRELLVFLVDGLDEEASPGGIGMLLPNPTSTNTRLLIGSRISLVEYRRRDGLLPTEYLDHFTQVEISHGPYGAPVIAPMFRLLAESLSRPSGIERDLFGYLAGARAPLTPSDFADLTDRTLAEVLTGLHAVGRTLVSYQEGASEQWWFRHVEIFRSVTGLLGKRYLSSREDEIMEWARQYAATGWPDGTPSYLLGPFGRVLQRRGDPREMDFFLSYERLIRAHKTPGASTYIAEEFRALREVAWREGQGNDLAGLRLSHAVKATFFSQGFADLSSTAWRAIARTVGVQFAMSLWARVSSRPSLTQGLLGIATAASGQLRNDLLQAAIGRARTFPPWSGSKVLAEVAELVEADEVETVLRNAWDLLIHAVPKGPDDLARVHEARSALLRATGALLPALSEEMLSASEKQYIAGVPVDMTVDEMIDIALAIQHTHPRRATEVARGALREASSFTDFMEPEDHSMLAAMALRSASTAAPLAPRAFWTFAKTMVELLGDSEDKISAAAALGSAGVSALPRNQAFAKRCLLSAEALVDIAASSQNEAETFAMLTVLSLELGAEPSAEEHCSNLLNSTSRIAVRAVRSGDAHVGLARGWWRLDAPGRENVLLSALGWLSEHDPGNAYAFAGLAPLESDAASRAEFATSVADAGFAVGDIVGAIACRRLIVSLAEEGHIAEAQQAFDQAWARLFSRRRTSPCYYQGLLLPALAAISVSSAQELLPSILSEQSTLDMVSRRDVSLTIARWNGTEALEIARRGDGEGRVRRALGVAAAILYTNPSLAWQILQDAVVDLPEDGLGTFMECALVLGGPEAATYLLTSVDPLYGHIANAVRMAELGYGPGHWDGPAPQASR